MTALTVSRLKELLSYDPETGEFVRLVGVKGAAAGEMAGSKMTNGYIAITVDYHDYLAHRLAWFYMTGSWPREYIDHSNGVRSDNIWQNLREATQSQQNANTKRRKDNTSGFKGVRWHSQCKKWNARICVNGKQSSLGLYDNPEEAHRVYMLAARERFGEFARAG